MESACCIGTAKGEQRTLWRPAPFFDSCARDIVSSQPLRAAYHVTVRLFAAAFSSLQPAGQLASHRRAPAGVHFSSIDRVPAPGRSSTAPAAAGIPAGLFDAVTALPDLRRASCTSTACKKTRPGVKISNDDTQGDTRSRMHA